MGVNAGIIWRKKKYLYAYLDAPHVQDEEAVQSDAAARQPDGGKVRERTSSSRQWRGWQVKGRRPPIHSTPLRRPPISCTAPN